MFCCDKKSKTDVVKICEDGKKFKSLMETYTMYMFFLTFGLMYPNPHNDQKRKKLIGCYISTIIPTLVIVSVDMKNRVVNNDMANLVRQSIIMVSLVFVIIKAVLQLVLTIVRKNELREIFDQINEDYEAFNHLPEESQRIVQETIQKTKALEKIWIGVLGVTASTYPILACVCTIYSQIFSENPRRFMIHETSMLYLTEEQKYQSPYFEITAVYSMYIVAVIFLGFSGYDGMFSVCTLHVSLKIKIFCQNLKHLLDDTEDVATIKMKLAKVVKDHCEVHRLITKIEKCFEVWLVGIFVNAVLQIGMALSQITSNADTDINRMYYFYAVATVVHIYLPCYLASDVTHNAAEVANIAYDCSWETTRDLGIQRSIGLIITKAHIPINLNAMGMLTFNMEMFVSILQTSYSMYTLLRT